jgi:hypothetical protein
MEIRMFQIYFCPPHPLPQKGKYFFPMVEFEVLGGEEGVQLTTIGNQTNFVPVQLGFFDEKPRNEKLGLLEGNLSAGTNGHILLEENSGFGF